MAVIASDAGYCPIELGTAMEKIVVDGNRRKYTQLGRTLRFYGGTTSATEVGCNLRCKFCFSDKPVWKPARTGRFYTPEQVFNGLAKMPGATAIRQSRPPRLRERWGEITCSSYSNWSSKVSLFTSWKLTA